MTDLRPIYEIADEIRRTWKPVNYAAKPYLDALGSLSTCRDSYGFDSGKGIVTYFLANASTFRGDDARRIKNELKAHLKAA